MLETLMYLLRKVTVLMLCLVAHKVVKFVGIAVIINKEVVDNLTTEQLRQILTGEITNWKEVGGKDLAISIINRAASSGSRATFDSVIMNGQSGFRVRARFTNGMADHRFPNPLGLFPYLAFAYVDDSAGPNLMAMNQFQNVTNTGQLWSYEHVYTW